MKFKLFPVVVLKKVSLKSLMTVRSPEVRIFQGGGGGGRRKGVSLSFMCNIIDTDR